MAGKLIILAICALVFGCAGIRPSLENYNACAVDPACVAKVNALSAGVAAVAVPVTAPLGTPLSAAIIVVLSSIASVLGGMLFGKKVIIPGPGSVILPPSSVQPPTIIVQPKAP